MAATISVASLAGCSASKDASGDATANAEESYGNTAYPDIDITKYVTLKDGYMKEKAKGLPKKTSYTDDDAKAYINSQGNTQTFTDKEKVKKGDSVNIDIKGTISGKEFDGGTIEGYTLEIGSGQMIEGFEDSIIGIEAGKSDEIEATFPKDYSNKNLAGKTAKFKVKVNSITRAGELTDEKVAELTSDKYKSVDEYVAFVKKYLEWYGNVTYVTNATEPVMTVIEKYVEIKDVPDELVEWYTDQALAHYKDYASYYGQSIDELLAAKGNGNYSNEDEFRKYVKDNAKDQLKWDMAAMAIAEDKNIEFSKQDYEDFLTYDLFRFNSQYSSKTELETALGKENIKWNLLYNKVIGYLAENMGK